MIKRLRQQLKSFKRRIERRLSTADATEQGRPVFRSGRVCYEIAERVRAVAAGGVALMHQIAQATGLVREIDERVHLLKMHLPYHESDHVLNITYNILAGGTCLEDLERLRNDENYLDMMGVQRIPDPTTAGDFCRRFVRADQVEALMDAVNESRLRVWKTQPDEFFEEALIDGDGTIAETTAECKEGIDLTYKGLWGYHPLLISLANTQEPLFFFNRSGSRPSSEGAVAWFDRAVALTRRAGFRKITLRGDTDFSQTRFLDRWDRDGVEFVFGYDAYRNLVDKAESLESASWTPLLRGNRYEIRTGPRQRPANVRQKIVEERELNNLYLLEESVAEFDYRPGACRKAYRIVAVRKLVSHEKGQQVLFADYRYFFYLTNKRGLAARKIVELANTRCDQERLIEQMKNGVHAMRLPVDNLFSNWAYMVMASIAWSLKAWFALLLPVEGRWRSQHEREKDGVLRMRFRTFLNSFMLVPAQVVSTGRRLVLRLLSWNPWQRVFFRGLRAITDVSLC